MESKNTFRVINTSSLNAVRKWLIDAAVTDRRFSSGDVGCVQKEELPLNWCFKGDMGCVQKEELPLTWCSRGDMGCVQKEELPLDWCFKGDMG